MRTFYTLLFSLLFMAGAVAQNSVVGTVIDGDTNEPLIGASVYVKSSSVGTITDIDGKFKLNGIADGSHKVDISYVGYETMSVRITVAGAKVDMGTMALNTGGLGLDEVVVTGVMDIVRDRRTPVAVSTINIAQIQAKGVGNVEFPEVMKNTPSVYVSSQTGFGDSQMFLRGFDQTNTAFLLNGQPINGMEDGRMYWSNWSGMSDVASAVQVQRGLGSSKLAISSVGGTVNIVTKTVDNTKGGFGRLMVGNDGYLKGTLAYNSGMKGKWAYSVLLDHWQADNKWAEGTKGQGQNYFFSVGYKPNSTNTFNFLITGAPQWHGQRWSQSEETLNDTPKFNQHYGVNQGEWESERKNYYHKPVINLSWDWDINSTSSLSSVLYASFGRGGGTGDFGRGRVRTEEGQVDFDAIRVNNTADSDGIGENDDNYAIRSSVNNHQWFGNVTSYNKDLSENITWNIGLDMRMYTGDHFRQISDFLGLEGWNESFRHANRPSDYVVSQSYDSNPWSALFDFAEEGERVSYDYSESINYQGVFTQLEYSKNNISLFVQGALSNQSYQREGRWSDIAKSDKVNKLGYNVKSGASYEIASGNIIFANVGYYSRQPFLDNIFENIRYSNDLVSPEIDNEKVTGIEAGYKFTKNNFKADLNAYYTTWNNRSLVSSFTNENGTPDDNTDDFTQRNVERGIGQVHQGIELDLKYKINKLRISGYTSIGDWTYSNIDNVQVFNDDTGELIEEVEGANIEGVHVPNAPQFSLGVGLEYQVLDGLSMDADFNFYDNLYRRDNFDDKDVVIRTEIGKLPSYSLIDLGATYKFKLGNQNLILRGNIYNLLDEFYFNQSDPFGLINGNGLTWNTSLKVLF